MLTQIQAYAKMATPTSLDPALVVSKAVTLTQGTVASGANRYDADTIAKYLFSEGAGSTMAYDTSGIDPSADLTLTGHYQFDGSWGLIFLAGGAKAQATVQASSKLNTLIQATGEFSIETWVAPAVVATNLSDIVSYSGGDTLRNVTLAQTNQDYDFSLRGSNSDLNGMPMLQTPNSTMALQASLQHVVLTYDPVNGRQIYVNGVNQNIPDPQKGGTISNWDSTFALVLGSEVSGDNPFQGEIKFLAIHSRALSATQVLQNFNAGVGQRYYLLFNISNVPGVNVSQAYMMFTVSQYDNYSYLFYEPTFISLDSTAKPTNIPVSGMRIGINGTIPLVGQAWIPLNTAVTAANYSSTSGDILSTVGSIIGLENGPLTDQFFLQFDTLGTAHDVIVEATPQPADPGPGPPGRRLRRAHLRPGELHLLAAHRRTHVQLIGGHDLSERPAAAAGDQHARGLLGREPGRRRAARGSILQPGDAEPDPAGEAVPHGEFQQPEPAGGRQSDHRPADHARGGRHRDEHADLGGADRARQPREYALQRRSTLQQFGARQCGHRRGLRCGARQRQRDDRLIGSIVKGIVEVQLCALFARSPGA